MSRSGIQLSVPSGGPIDWEHLDRATLGDAALADEVLRLFDKQAGQVADTIRDLPPDTARLAHGIKGSARGIGAFKVADLAQRLEAVLSDPLAAKLVAAELIGAIRAVREAIGAHLSKA